MSDEAGQGSGVALSLDLRLNADKNGTVFPLCTAQATRRECRFAVSFNNRGNDLEPLNPKQWIVLKGVSGRVYVPYLALEGDSVTYITDDKVTPATVAAMKFSFGGSANKIQVKNLVIDNVAVEQDSTTTPGFMRDTGTSSGASNNTAAYVSANSGNGANSGFMGLQISGYVSPTDTATANIAINGTLKVFACSANHQSC